MPQVNEVSWFLQTIMILFFFSLTFLSLNYSSSFCTSIFSKNSGSLFSFVNLA